MRHGRSRFGTQFFDERSHLEQSLLSDMMVLGLLLGPSGVYVADVHELSQRCKPGIADDWFFGDFED